MLTGARRGFAPCGVNSDAEFRYLDEVTFNCDEVVPNFVRDAGNLVGDALNPDGVAANLDGVAGNLIEVAPNPDRGICCGESRITTVVSFPPPKPACPWN